MFGCVSLIYLTIQNAGFHQQATRFGMVKPSKTVVQLYMFILKKYMDLVNANAGLINPPPEGQGRPCGAPLNNKHLRNHKTLDMAYVN